MHKCLVKNKHGHSCRANANHEYNGRPLCEKHWNNGHLTDGQPDEEVYEARRRIAALIEMPIILESVTTYVIKKPLTSGRQMAAMSRFLADMTGILNKKERRDITRLIVTMIKLNRQSTPENEHIAFRKLAEMVKEVYA